MFMFHLLVCLAVLRACSGQVIPSDPKYYPVVASQAYTWPRGYPQACACAEGKVKKNSCDLFRCDCICDVTAGVCDYNCCCDVDCSADQKARFEDLGACESEGYESSDIQHCYSSNELYGVNPREPMGGQATANEAVSQALCVVQKNTAMKEEFYNSAEVVGSSVFSTDEGQKTYSYLAPAPVTVAVDANYDQNDTINAFTTSGSAVVSNGPGYLQLPQPDFTGHCNDDNYVNFEDASPPQSCARTLSTDEATFAAQCESQFSLSRYVTDLFVAKAANSLTANGNTVLAGTVPVTLKSVYFEDYLTGNTSSITTSWASGACATTAYTAGATVNAACSFSDAATAAALLNYPALCQGFVKAVYYSVSHSTSTAAPITTVNATVTLSDVPMAGNATAPAVTVVQTFGSRFYSDDPTEKSSDNGNLVKRSRSGNPGYIQGKPVLYGALPTSTSTVINELVAGFTVPSAIAAFDPTNPEAFGRALCPTATTATTSSTSATTVQFGYDLTTGCSVALNRTQLINLCCAGSGTCSGVVGAGYSSEYSNAVTGIPYFYDYTQGYVGIYGDADPLDIGQWSQMTYTVPSDTRRWTEATSTCSNMFNGLEIQFLVAATGSRTNPQNKIISSLASITTGSWTMKLPVSDTTSQQNFPLSLTVSFVFQDEDDVREYVVPAPPVLFKVPYDVFYPFINSAPPRFASQVVFGSVSIGVVVSALCAAWLVM